MSEEVQYPWRKVVKTPPLTIKTPATNVIKMGHVPELSSFRERIRERLGLEGKPPTFSEEAVPELRLLVKQTKLGVKVAWNEEED